MRNGVLTSSPRPGAALRATPGLHQIVVTDSSPECVAIAGMGMGGIPRFILTYSGHIYLQQYADCTNM